VLSTPPPFKCLDMLTDKVKVFLDNFPLAGITTSYMNVTQITNQHSTNYVIFNPFMGTLKPQSNGSLYSKTLVGGLLHFVQQGGA